MGTAFHIVCKDMDVETISFSHDELDIVRHAAVNDAIRKLKPDVVINCVAIPSIEPCQQNPEQALDLHCTAVLNLARICTACDAILVQPSTHAVFDGEKLTPYTETDQIKATSVYSATKYLSEYFAEKYAAKYYVTRFPSLYGPRRNHSKGFVDKVFDWFNAGKPLKIADDKIDSPTYSIDAATIIMNMVRDRLPYGIYHVANQGALSYYEFVLKIKAMLGYPNEVFPAKDRDFPSSCYKPLRSALRSEKQLPSRSIDEALQDYVNRYISNRDDGLIQNG